MVDHVAIKDPNYDVSPVTHRISVRVDQASEHSWANSSSNYTYVIRLSYRKGIDKTSPPNLHIGN